jgi:hypothetical protein
MAASRVRAGGVLLFLAAFPLVPTLFAPFLADDYLHIDVASRLSRSPASLASGWVLPVASTGAWWTPPGLSVEYFRPLIVVSFAIDRLLYGVHAWGYHLTNILAHCVATLFVWRIGRRTLGEGFGAWAAAALFAIHPCHAGAIDWISGRTDVLAGTFFAASLAIHLDARQQARLPLGATTASLACFLCALLCKEMAITLPAIVLVDAFLRPAGQSPARRLVMVGLMGAVACGYLALRTHMLGGFHSPPSPFAFHLGEPGFVTHLVMAPVLYLADLVLFILPEPMVTYPFWRSHPAFFIAMGVAIAAVFAGTVRRAPDAAARIWGLAWVGITVLPVLALPVGEHFLYLPSMGYCLLVGSQLPVSTAAVDRGMRRGLLGTAIGVLAVLLVRTVMFDAGAYAADAAVHQAVEAIDRAPLARTVLVADLPAPASLTFPYAVRQLRPSTRADIETLSVSARLLTRDDGPSSARFVAPDRLELSREGGFLVSYIERALEGPHRPFHEGQSFDRHAYTVTVLQAPSGTLRSFAVTLHDPGSTLVLGNMGPGLGPLPPP